VLLAAFLARSEDAAERERGMTTLLAAAQRRPMFTDGYALLLQLLRRWPGGGFEGVRQEALGAAVQAAGVVDWDATFFTTQHGSEPPSFSAAPGPQTRTASWSRPGGA
jgi:hypothetical protein